jgi:hypothetical protein
MLPLLSRFRPSIAEPDRGSNRAELEPGGDWPAKHAKEHEREGSSGQDNRMMMIGIGKQMAMVAHL